MSAWLVTNLAATLLLPPTILLLGLFAGLFLLRRHRRLAMPLLVVSTLALYGLSTPLIGELLLKTLEPSPPLADQTLHDADAIVVLGGGRRLAVPEYGGRDTLTELSMQRLLYAAHLHRTSGKPVLVTGGMPGGGTTSEGELMRDVLTDEFGEAPRWVETASATTWDNARLSAPMLRAAGVKRIALVTHAWHLRRAIPLFRVQGFDVVPAGVGYATPQVRTPLDLLPSANALRGSYFALHEWLGVLWYKLRSLSSESQS